MTASDFLNQIINRYLSPTKIVVGYDFKFGCNQQGTHLFLKTGQKIIAPSLSSQNKRHRMAPLLKAVSQRTNSQIISIKQLNY